MAADAGALAVRGGPSRRMRAGGLGLIAAAAAVALVLPVAASASPRVQTIAGEKSLQGIDNVAASPDGDVLATLNRPFDSLQIRRYDDQGSEAPLGLDQSGGGQISNPEDAAFGPDGTIYVATAEPRVLHFAADGSFISSFGEQGTGPGQLKRIDAMAIGANGEVLIADGGNGTVQLFDSDGHFVRAFGTVGHGPGEFTTPADVALGMGQVLIVDPGEKRVLRFDRDGSYIDELGLPGAGEGHLASPAGVAVEANGDVLVSDSQAARVQRFKPSGEPRDSFSTAAPALGPRRSRPGDLEVDGQGHIVIGDPGLERISTYSPQGALLGEVGATGSALGKLDGPRGIATAPGGGFYVTEAGNDRVHRFSADGTAISTFGGSGSAEGQLRDPAGIAVASDGDVFVDDSGNGRVQRFTAGGDFVAAFGEADLVKPTGVAIAPDDSIYVLDQRDQSRVVHFDASGDTLGTPIFAYALAGSSLAVGPGDEIYLSDTDGDIQRYSSSGQKVGTITGEGEEPLSNLYAYSFTVAPNGDVYTLRSFRHDISVFRPDGSFVERFSDPAFESPIAIAATGSADQVLVLSLGSVQRVGRAPIRVSVSPVGPARVKDRTPTVSFSSTAPQTTFECRVDEGAWGPCSGPGDTHTPADPLADGTHTFYVRGTDADGDVSDVQSVRVQVVNRGPRTEIFETSTDQYTHVTHFDSLSVYFYAIDPNAVSYECGVDGAAFSDCGGSPYRMTDLAEGPHTFVVRATDDLGNVGAPETLDFIVDAKKPVISVASGPGTDHVVGDDPEFRFSASEPIEQYYCAPVYAYNSGEFEPCGDDGSYTPHFRDDGYNQITVYARDSAGNTSEWIHASAVVDRTAPTFSFVDGPDNDETITTAHPVFGFLAEDAQSQVSYSCSFDGGAYQRCESGGEWPGGADDGYHFFRVRASDELGNTSEPQLRSFRVDSHPPEIEISAPATVRTRQGSASVTAHVEVSEPADIVCQVDTRPGRHPCPSRLRLKLPTGKHHLLVTAQDEAGLSSQKRVRIEVVRKRN